MQQIVFLKTPGGASTPLGRYDGADERAVIRAAHKACANSLKRLVAPGYKLVAGATTMTLEQLRGR